MSPVFQRWITTTVGALTRRRPEERRLSSATPGETGSPAADERDQELRRLSAAVLRILELNHDASSALSAALINAEHLMKLKEDPSGDQIREVASELAVSLFRLRDLLSETREVGQSLGSSEIGPRGAVGPSRTGN